MGNRGSRSRYYALVFITTVSVVVVPAVVVYVLRVNNVVTGFWACLGLAAGLALVASFGSSALWRRHRLLPEVVFSELLIWGSVRRAYTERQISRALASLDRLGSTASAEERTKFLKKLAVAVDARDPYLNNHSRQVARHAAGTARRMSMHGSDVALIETAALLHDVGKLNTPPEILQKQGPLTDAERAVMREHANDGAELVGTLDDTSLVAIVRHHHERIDGGGYPSGLKGERIPLGARVIAVADTFDAITAARPYRDGKEDQQAIDILRQEEGRQLDPAAVTAFVRYYSDRDISAFLSALLSSPRTGFLRSVRSAVAGSVAAGFVAAAAVAASAPASTPGVATPFSAQRVASEDSQKISPPPRNGRRRPPAHRPRHTLPPAPPRTPPSARTTQTAPVMSSSSSTTTTRLAPRPPTPSTTETRPVQTRPAVHTSSPKPIRRPKTPKPPRPPIHPPPATTTTPSPAVPPVLPPPTTTTTPAPTTTSTNTTTTTSTTPPPSTTTTTPPIPPILPPPTNPCANGGWKSLGYPNYGQCVSAQNH
ncbi:MAG: HD-GYP domain-containing protein [Solirubrobacteraceae bacterium]